MIWLLPFAAYLLGSVSFAWIAGKLNGIDLREHGSRNLGATNAGRVLGRKWFLIVFTADLLKGLLPVLAALHGPARLGLAVERPLLLAIASAAGAILGHVFTCYHGFKGGKAVATSLGVLIALMPAVAGAAFALWLVAWTIGWAGFRCAKSAAVGPASVVAALAAPGLHCWFSRDPLHGDLPLTVFIALLALLVVAKHRSNIAKLFARPSPPAG
jgi:glycerol-3-phosphate acyltransferase PlsY